MNTHDNPKPAPCTMTRLEPLHADSIVEATYRPREDDPAPVWAEHLVGRRSKWLVRFMLGNGSHAGQWALSPYPLADGPAGYWVPLSELHGICVLGELFDEYL